MKRGKCPFLKETTTELQNNNLGLSSGSVLIEEFQECIANKCMAWNDNYKECKLMRSDFNN